MRARRRAGGVDLTFGVERQWLGRPCEAGITRMLKELLNLVLSRVLSNVK